MLLLFHRKRNAIMQHELKEAASDTRGVTAECLTTAVSNSVGPIMASPSAMPSKATIRFVSTPIVTYLKWLIVILFYSSIILLIVSLI